MIPNRLEATASSPPSERSNCKGVSTRAPSGLAGGTHDNHTPSGNSSLSHPFPSPGRVEGVCARHSTREIPKPSVRKSGKHTTRKQRAGDEPALQPNAVLSNTRVKCRVCPLVEDSLDRAGEVAEGGGFLECTRCSHDARRNSFLLLRCEVIIWISRCRARYPGDAGIPAGLLFIHLVSIQFRRSQPSPRASFQPRCRPSWDHAPLNLSSRLSPAPHLHHPLDSMSAILPPSYAVTLVVLPVSRVPCFPRALAHQVHRRQVTARGRKSDVVRELH